MFLRQVASRLHEMALSVLIEPRATFKPSSEIEKNLKPPRIPDTWLSPAGIFFE